MGVMTAQETKMTVQEISNFKKQISEVSRVTNTINSDFVQYKHLDFLENDIESVGKMVYKSPNLVKWEYTKPYQYSVVFKNEQLLINDGGNKSKVDIGNNKLFKEINQMMVNSVKGDMFNNDEFTVAYFETPKFYRIVLTPMDKKLKNYIASFELMVNKKDAAVQEVKMVEPSQDYTRIVFSNRTLNAKVNDTVFTN